MPKLQIFKTVPPSSRAGKNGTFGPRAKNMAAFGRRNGRPQEVIPAHIVTPERLSEMAEAILSVRNAGFVTSLPCWGSSNVGWQDTNPTNVIGDPRAYARESIFLLNRWSKNQVASDFLMASGVAQGYASAIPNGAFPLVAIQVQLSGNNYAGLVGATFEISYGIRKYTTVVAGTTIWVYEQVTTTFQSTDDFASGNVANHWFKLVQSTDTYSATDLSTVVSGAEVKKVAQPMVLQVSNGGSLVSDDSADAIAGSINGLSIKVTLDDPTNVTIRGSLVTNGHPKLVEVLSMLNSGATKA